MKDFKGTPGPWSAVQQYVDEVSVIDSDGFKVVTAERTAILMDWDKKGFEHWGDDGGSRHLSGPEQFANAYLIAAAPDLLEALQGYMSAVSEMNEAMKDGYNVQGAMSALIGWEDMARAAISKALGEE